MIPDLLTVLNMFVQLSPEENQLISNSFTSKTLSKGDFFSRAGDISKYIGFIQNGLVRYFFLKEGEELTFSFAKEGEFIGDYTSFNRKIGSMYSIQAIENCEILVINYENLNNFFDNTPNGNLLARLITEYRFDILASQLMNMHLQNSEQRYQSFVTEYADLTQRIPLYMIASYVGVHPASLSRIRKRLAE